MARNSRRVRQRQTLSEQIERYKITSSTVVSLGVPLIFMGGIVAVVYFIAGKTTIMDARLDIALGISLAATVASGAYALFERKTRKQYEKKLDDCERGR